MQYNINRPVPPPVEVTLTLTPQEFKVIAACVRSSLAEALKDYGVDQRDAVNLLPTLREIEATLKA